MTEPLRYETLSTLLLQTSRRYTHLDNAITPLDAPGRDLGLSDVAAAAIPQIVTDIYTGTIARLSSGSHSPFPVNPMERRKPHPLTRQISTFLAAEARRIRFNIPNSGTPRCSAANCTRALRRILNNPNSTTGYCRSHGRVPVRTLLTADGILPNGTMVRLTHDVNALIRAGIPRSRAATDVTITGHNERGYDRFGGVLLTYRGRTFAGRTLYFAEEHIGAVLP